MFKLIHKRVPSNAKNDILSGLTVALALVPEAVAFALLAGLNPLVGLYAAFTIGLVTSILGGRPGMISGATGAIAVVIALPHTFFGRGPIFWKQRFGVVGQRIEVEV